MQNKPNRKDNKKVNFFINEGLDKEINAKLLVDDITKKDILTTSLRAYINGEATTITKDGKEIFFKCEVK